VYVETTEPGAIPKAYFCEVRSEVLEQNSRGGDISGTIRTPVAPQTTSIVASTTEVAFMQIRLSSLLNGKPNPYNGILDDINVKVTQSTRVNIYLVTDTVGPGGFDASTLYPADVEFTFPGDAPSWSDVPRTDEAGVFQVRYFATNTTFTLGTYARDIDSFVVEATDRTSREETNNFARARRVLGTMGDGANATLLVTCKREANQDSTVSLVDAHLRAIL
jgi:hypothetical protein